MIDIFLEKSDEAALLEDLDRIRKSNMRKIFYSCYIGFDRTVWFSRHREYFDVVTHSVSKFVFQNQGKLYKLHNFDICFTVRVENPKLVEKLIFRLFATLQQHSTALGMTDPQIEEVTNWYQLEDDLGPLLDRVQRVAANLEELTERKKKMPARPASGSPGSADPPPFSAQALSDVEKALERAEIDNFLRVQPVCAVSENVVPVPIFREVHVSMEHLRRQIAPNVEMRGARALFHHLTRILDHKVLRALMGGYISANFGPFSINLTANTVLSNTFSEFDERIVSVAKRNQIIIELQRYDIFGNYRTFSEAVELLRAKGYRVLIDGMTPPTLNLLHTAGISVDFVKMFIFKDEMETWHNPDLSRMINQNTGLAILARCGTEAECRLATDAGIRMLQGWYIDDAVKGKLSVIAPGT
jgi:EAL domain-containing protein (putative c-di-GMP-specific phosphodiesterase class I)